MDVLGADQQDNVCHQNLKKTKEKEPSKGMKTPKGQQKALKEKGIAAAEATASNVKRPSPQSLKQQFRDGSNGRRRVHNRRGNEVSREFGIFKLIQMFDTIRTQSFPTQFH